VIDKEEPLLTIGVVARKLNTSVHSIRLYEREGLLLSYKKESGHRLFSEKDVERIVCIKKSITENKVSINGMRMLLSLIPCWKIKNCPKDERDTCPAFLEHESPCWQYKDTVKGDCATNDCRICPVYTSIGSCEELKSLLQKFMVLDSETAETRTPTRINEATQ